MKAYRKTCVAVRIRADNDSNGNPRRGWLVYKTPRGEYDGGEYLGFVDEGYKGQSALTRAFPKAREVASIPTTPAFYQQFLKPLAR